jgi:hypothetical protein
MRGGFTVSRSPQMSAVGIGLSRRLSSQRYSFAVLSRRYFPTYRRAPIPSLNAWMSA